MASNFPTSLDTSSEQPSPSSTTDLDATGFEHDVVHANHSTALIAVETKLGIGSADATGASSGDVLTANGSGGSSWAAAGGSPSGAVSMWAGSTAPSGWLECDGAAVSRTTYSDLFAAVGTRYGVGDGSTTFNLPNPIDKLAMGIASGTSPTATTLAGASSLDALGLGNESVGHTHNFSANTGAATATHTHTGNTGN
ncbi:MAG: tail fiber protein, partial [Gammaproteobacteria bacterium]|nr:tail fiber protein [Gammaproteobacteria bacterium]